MDMYEKHEIYDKLVLFIFHRDVITKDFKDMRLLLNADLKIFRIFQKHIKKLLADFRLKIVNKKREQLENCSL